METEALIEAGMGFRKLFFPFCGVIKSSSEWKVDGLILIYIRQRGPRLRIGSHGKTPRRRKTAQNNFIDQNFIYKVVELLVCFSMQVNSMNPISSPPVIAFLFQTIQNCQPLGSHPIV